MFQRSYFKVSGFLQNDKFYFIIIFVFDEKKVLLRSFPWKCLMLSKSKPFQKKRKYVLRFELEWKFIVNSFIYFILLLTQFLTMNISLFKAIALQLQLQLLVHKLFDSPFTWRKVSSTCQGQKRCRCGLSHSTFFAHHQGQHVLTLLSYR